MRVCVCVCVCVRARALRIVSRDKILRFKKYFYYYYYKAMHQTILGSRIQEQGRCLAQLQAQVFSHGLDLEPEEEQTN